MIRPSERQREFIKHLKELAERKDRGALAQLRRGLGREPGSDLAMAPYVTRYIPAAAGAWEEAAYYLVAALFAWHPRDWDEAEPEAEGHNLGASFARLAMLQGPAEARARSTEQRFGALLNSHRDDLHVHLRQAVSLLKSKEVPVNWDQLLADVCRWNAPDRPVQRAWAKAFWAPGANESDQATGTDTSRETALRARRSVP